MPDCVWRIANLLTAQGRFTSALKGTEPVDTFNDGKPSMNLPLSPVVPRSKTGTPKQPVGAGKPHRFGSWKRILSWILLLPVPLVLVLAALAEKRAQGPYWLGSNQEPGYEYFISALRVCQTGQAGYKEHPGVTTITFGALVIRTAHLFRGEGDFVTDLLKDPEPYVNAINRALVGLASAALIVGGGIVFRWTGNLLLALLIQLTPFLSNAVIQAMATVASEPMLFVVGLFLGLTVYAYAMGGEKRSWLFAVLLGLGCGLDVATKFTALPVILLPVVLLPWRQKLVSLPLILLGFVIATIPIMGRYKGMIEWVWNLATHKQEYGTGEAGVLGFQEFVDNATSLLQQEPVPAFIIALSLVALSFRFLPTPFSTLASPGLFKGLLALTLTELFQIALVAKHPDIHYLVPALSLLGLNLVLISQMVFRAKMPILKIGYTAALLGGLAFVMILQGQQLEAFRRVHSAFRDQQLEVCREADKNCADCTFIHYYGSSTIPHALWIGNHYFDADYFSGELRELYPDAFFYGSTEAQWDEKGRERMEGSYYDWNGKVDVAEIRARKPRVILRGMAFCKWNAAPPDLEFQQVFPSATEEVGEEEFPQPEILYQVVPE